MNEPRLTEEQRRAVDIAENVTITAGAGAGKTEVMTRRIIRVLGELDHISELLAVTFTDKAAGEIRRRVYRALLQKIRETPSEPDRDDERARFEKLRDEFLENQIGTMHTFFAYLLRRFPEAVEGLDPDFQIIEGAEQEDLLRSSVESVLDGVATNEHSPLRDDLRLCLRQHGRKGEIAAAVETLILKRIETAQWLRHFTETAIESLSTEYRAFSLSIVERGQAAFFQSAGLKSLRQQIEACLAESDDPTDPLYDKRNLVLAALREQHAPALKRLLLTKEGKPSRFGNSGRARTWGKETLAFLRDRMNVLAELVGTDAALALEWDDEAERETTRTLRALARLTHACLVVYADRKARAHVLDFADLEAFA